MIFEVEVDVAIARPPTPSNTRTRHVIVHIDDSTCASVADIQAQLIASQIAAGRKGVVMPTATRILSLEL